MFLRFSRRHLRVSRQVAARARPSLVVRVSRRYLKGSLLLASVLAPAHYYGFSRAPLESVISWYHVVETWSLHNGSATCALSAPRFTLQFVRSKFTIREIRFSCAQQEVCVNRRLCWPSQAHLIQFWHERDTWVVRTNITAALLGSLMSRGRFGEFNAAIKIRRARRCAPKQSEISWNA